MAGHWTRVGAELIRDRRLAALSIGAKAALARAIWGIHASKFLMLGLHEQPMRHWEESMDFQAELDPVLRMINWAHGDKRLDFEKLIAAERLAEAGIPSAPLIACIGRDSAAHPHGGRFPQWSSVEEIVAALPKVPDRLFGKPAIGQNSRGAIGPERRDGGWTVAGEAMSDRDFANHLLRIAPPSGLLLQERVRSHPGLAPIGGELGLGTFRINTALTADGPEVMFVWGKLMGKRNLADNFLGGRTGNMIARVDKETGRITHVLGRKPGQRFLMETVTEHPVTGAAMAGFQLPLWKDTVALAKRLATAIPEVPLIGADVAISDRGPLIIETNRAWDADSTEAGIGRGLRPVLREIIPRLALDEEVKRQALACLAPSRAMRNRRRKAVVQRQP